MLSIDGEAIGNIETKGIVGREDERGIVNSRIAEIETGMGYAPFDGDSIYFPDNVGGGDRAMPIPSPSEY